MKGIVPLFLKEHINMNMKLLTLYIRYHLQAKPISTPLALTAWSDTLFNPDDYNIKLLGDDDQIRNYNKLKAL